MAEPVDDERPAARPGSRYPLLVGLVFLVLIGIATVDTLGEDEGGVLGGEQTELGTALPAFALPELLGEVEADANVFQDDCETSVNPCPEDDRRVPACEIEAADAIRVCDLLDRPLVLSFWFGSPAGCPPTQDAVDALARRYRGRVNFLSVAIGGDHEELREIAREGGWELPLGWDRDGAVASLLRVGGCPTVALALPGGILHDALIGDAAGESGLRTAIERLLAAARRQARASR